MDSGLLHLSPAYWDVLQVVEALRPYGLTLQNFASIREQAIGGFVQVGLPTCTYLHALTMPWCQGPQTDHVNK